MIEGGRSELIVQVSAPEPIASYGSAMVFLRASNQEGLAAAPSISTCWPASSARCRFATSRSTSTSSGEWHGGLAIELPVGVNIDARPTVEYC